ncbi:MAG TPA: CHAD domain-containing protein [Tepidisphaeraceae bacterium]|jgi:CHAD domain-containing protein|nr:CHAD domain-containing protein [Tepidisphaeraceae bacterium]
MAFELKQDEKIAKGVRRIVCKRIDKALEKLNGEKGAVNDSAVHDARKRFKEIRGTLRLVREELGEKRFRRENKIFRDAGRPLSVLRDAKVLIDTLDGLIAHFDGRVKPQSAARLRRALLGRRRDIREQVIKHDGAIPKIKRDIASARGRVENWPLQRPGWKAIAGGIQKVYAQGHRAMTEVRENPSDASLHEWRKRAKDLRYELELLQSIWPETVKPLADQAHRLTDLLGDDHDLSVLRTVAHEESEDRSSADDELLFALIDERRTALQKEAREIGVKLYEETADDFVRRIKGYWKTSRQLHAMQVH